MISKHLIAALSYLFIVTVTVCNGLYSKDVKTFDQNSFKLNVGGSVPHFVSFFAPWCGYCKRLKPVWDDLAEKYNRGLKPKLVIAKVDCTVETALCANEGITGYPSLLFYNAGENTGVKFQGKRDLAGLEEFISNFLGEQDLSEPPSSVNGLVELDSANYEETLSYGMHFVKFYAPWCGHCQKLAPVWLDLADSLKNDKSVTVSQINCEDHKQTCNIFDVARFPTLLWIYNGKIIEKYDGERTLDDLKAFVKEMKLALNEVLNTEEGRIPDRNDEPNVVVELSAKNFENAISKGVTFVKFFVPWCGHCKRLEPIWNDLAVKYVSNPLVKIAQVDCTQEEESCVEHKVLGYPTLHIFRDGKFITEYHGDRNLDSLHSFVLEHIRHDEL